jgi:uncharacterized protein YbjT (DUF2867 family)
VLDTDRMAEAMAGIDVAYYLVHSLGSADFEAKDRAAAETFAAAAAAAGVRRIVYLGGPAVEGDSSAHLRSRSEVGRLLASTGVPTIVLRAAVIIGSGSAAVGSQPHPAHRRPRRPCLPRGLGGRAR